MKDHGYSGDDPIIMVLTNEIVIEATLKWLKNPIFTIKAIVELFQRLWVDL